MRVAGNKEEVGKYSKGNNNCDRGVRQRTAMAMKKTMATATRVAGNKEDDGDTEGNGNSDKGGRR
jgi:hypothetical protein